MKTMVATFAVMLVLSIGAVGADAQEPGTLVFEGLVGSAVPTFDITDLADPGFAFGVAAGYHTSDKILLLAEFDFGTHGGPDGGPDVTVSHYMGKLGYKVMGSDDSKWRMFVNAGAGAVMFDVDVPGAESNTYFAINAGAKIYYDATDMVSIVLSPQGDIAFVDEDKGFTGSTAWVWPFTAGIALRF